MVAAVSPAETQFNDANGDPLVAGTVEHYIPGTLIPKLTWQDPGGAVSNSNPILLDGGGRALIFGNGLYRQIVKDSLGNTIWDRATSAPGNDASPGSFQVGSVNVTAGQTVVTVPFQYGVSTNSLLVLINGVYQAGGYAETDNVTVTFDEPLPAGTVSFQGLAAVAVATAASSNVSFIQAGAGAVSGTLQTEGRYFIRPEQFGAVADGVTDDLIPIQNAFAQAAATGWPVVFSGGAYALSDGITFDLRECSYFGNGSQLNFTSAPDGTVCTTVIDGDGFTAKGQHVIDGFEFVGRDRFGTQVGTFFDSATNSGSAITCMRNCVWRLFGTGLLWGDNSFLNHFYGCNLRNNGICVDIAGTGSADFQENICFFGGVIFNSETLIRAANCELHLYGVSLDYPTIKHFDILAAANVVMHGGHVEGRADVDYWLDVNGTDSSLTLNGTEIAIADSAVKTAFPIGYSNATSASGINFNNVEFTGFNGAIYQFPYIIEGWGTCNQPMYINGGSGTGTDQLGAISHTRLNLLTDPDFEQTTVRDWFAENTGPVITSTALPRTGSRSLAMAPSAGQISAAETRFACSPGDWGIFVGYLNTAAWGTDSIYLRTGYADKFGNDAGSAFETEILAASRPTTYTRYAIRPFNAAPAGAAYYFVRVTKRGPTFTNSDGNGTLYVDTAAVQIFGNGHARQVEIYTFNRTAVTANTTFRVPNNYAIDGIKILNTTANAVTGGIRIGTTSGGTQVATSIAVGANADIYVPASALTLSYFSSTANQTTFFEAVTAWNSASLNVSYICRRVG